MQLHGRNLISLILQRDEIRPLIPALAAQRPLRAVEGPRGAHPVRGVGGGGRRSRGRAGEAAAARPPARGPPHAQAALRRRGDRLARPGPQQRGGHGLRGPALRRQRLPRVLLVRRRRGGGGQCVGGDGLRQLLPPRQPRQCD